MEKGAEAWGRAAQEVPGERWGRATARTWPAGARRARRASAGRRSRTFGGGGAWRGKMGLQLRRGGALVWVLAYGLVALLVVVVVVVVVAVVSGEREEGGQPVWSSC